MLRIAATALLLLASAILLLSAYFATLSLDRLPGLRRRLGGLFGACGIDTSSCAALAHTSQARLLGGVPNSVLGLGWGVALAGLALRWLHTGRLEVPKLFLIVAAASLAVGAYLVFNLLYVLRRPCPL
jgi:uncharacterized membrane protein